MIPTRPMKPSGQEQRGTTAPPRGRRRILFILVTVVAAALLAVALAAALAHAMLRRPSQDAVDYWGLMMVARHPHQATVRWPEYPGGEMTLNEPHPHYRRPWKLPKQKPADVPWRTVVLGDSHMSGVVPSGEAAVSILDRDSSPSQVVNMSIFGWGPVDALRYLRDDLAGHEFDSVIYVFYLGNDLCDIYRHGHYQMERRADGTYEEVPTTPLPPVSTAQRFLQDLGVPLEDHTTGPERRALLFRRMWMVNPGSVEQAFFQSLYFQDQPGKLDEALGAMRDIALRMKAVCDARGSSFTIALLPGKRMVEPDRVGDLVDVAKDVFKLRTEYVEIDETIRRAMAAWDGQDGLRVVDLTPALQAAYRARPDRPLFWRADFHLNTDGHIVVADELRGLLPGHGADGGTTAAAAAPAP